MFFIASDSSPLISLASINRFCILEKHYDHIIIPPAVWTEITDDPHRRPGCLELIKARDSNFVKIINPENLHLIQLLKNQLHEGEAEAIALALQEKAPILLIDEAEGREVAKSYSIPVIGVIGILAAAKKTSEIESMKTELDSLIQRTSFRVSRIIYDKALEMSGEL